MAARFQRLQIGPWLSVGVLFLLYVLSFADRQIVAMLVTPLKHDLHVSDVQVGLLVGLSFSLLYAVVGLPMGMLADRAPRRPMIWAGVSFWSLMTCACGLAQSFGSLLLFRAGVGVGEAVLPPAANSLIADKVPPARRALALSLFAMATSVGDAISFALGGIVLGLLKHTPTLAAPGVGTIHTWQVLFLIVGLPGFALAPLVFVFKDPPRSTPAAERNLASADFWDWGRRHWRVALCYALSFCLMGMPVAAVTQWTPAHMQRSFHWTPAQYGLALGAIFPVASVIGHIGCGSIVDFLGRRGRADAPVIFFMAVIVLCGPIAILGFLSPSPWFFLACLTLTKTILMPYLGYAIAGLMNAAPAAYRARTAAVFMFVLTLFAGVLGPILIGGLNDGLFHEAHLGWAVALVTGVCCVIALTALALGRTHYGRAVTAAAA